MALIIGVFIFFYIQWKARFLPGLIVPLDPLSLAPRGAAARLDLVESSGAVAQGFLLQADAVEHGQHKVGHRRTF